MTSAGRERLRMSIRVIFQVANGLPHARGGLRAYSRVIVQSSRNSRDRHFGAFRYFMNAHRDEGPARRNPLESRRRESASAANSPVKRAVVLSRTPQATTQENLCLGFGDRRAPSLANIESFLRFCQLPAHYQKNLIHSTAAGAPQMLKKPLDRFSFSVHDFSK